MVLKVVPMERGRQSNEISTMKDIVRTVTDDDTTIEGGALAHTTAVTMKTITTAEIASQADDLSHTEDRAVQMVTDTGTVIDVEGTKGTSVDGASEIDITTNGVQASDLTIRVSQTTDGNVTLHTMTDLLPD